LTTQKASQPLPALPGSIMKTSGNVRPQINRPFGRVKLPQPPRTTQIQNRLATPRRPVATHMPHTVQRPGTNEGKPDASSQSSCCAGEKIKRTPNKKTIVAAISGSLARPSNL